MTEPSRPYARRDRYLSVLRDLGLPRPEMKLRPLLSTHFTFDLASIDDALEDEFPVVEDRLWFLSFVRQLVLRIDAWWGSHVDQQLQVEDTGLSYLARLFSMFLSLRRPDLPIAFHYLSFYDSLFAVPYLTALASHRSSLFFIGPRSPSTHPSHFWSLLDHLVSSAEEQLKRRTDVDASVADQIRWARELDLTFPLLQYMVHVFEQHLATPLQLCREVQDCSRVISEFFGKPCPENLTEGWDAQRDRESYEAAAFQCPVQHMDSIRRDMAFFLSQWDMSPESLAAIATRLRNLGPLDSEISLDDFSKIVRPFCTSAPSLLLKLHRAAATTNALVVQGSAAGVARASVGGGRDDESDRSASSVAPANPSPLKSTASSQSQGSSAVQAPTILQCILTLSCLWHPPTLLDKCNFWVSVLDRNGDNRLDLEEVYVLFRSLHALYANPELPVPVSELGDLCDTFCRFFAQDAADTVGVFSPQRLQHTVVLQSPIYGIEYQFAVSAQQQQHMDGGMHGGHGQGAEDRLSDLGSTTSSMPLRESDWVRDHEAAVCAQCSRPFNVRRRKHHCRLCGLIFCGSCSSNKLRVNGAKEVRVCDLCFAKETGSVVRNILGVSSP